MDFPKTLQATLRKSIDIRFNWMNIFAFVFFWCYGVMGAVTFLGGGILLNGVLTSLLTLVLGYLLMSSRVRNQFDDSVTISGLDIAVFFSFMVCFALLAWRFLTASLVADELEHSRMSQRLVVSLVLLLSNKFESIGSYTFSWILFFFDLCLLGTLCAAYSFLRTRKAFFNSTIILVFVAFRVYYLLSKVYTPIHPPLVQFPLFISSSLFTADNLSFKLPQLLGLGLLSTFFVQRAARHLPFAVAWTLGLATGTIPVLLLTSSIVELSIWSIILFTLVLFSLEAKSSQTWLVSLACIFALLRHVAILGLVPIVVSMVIDRGRGMLQKSRLIFFAIPLIVALPFLVKLAALGSPATYNLNSTNSFVPAGVSAISKVFLSLQTGIGLNLLLKDLLPLYFGLMAVAFIPFAKKDFKFCVTLFVSFAALYFVFFTINPDIWGLPRYQAEIGIPFVLVGIWRIANSVSISFRPILAAAAVIMIGYNIFVIMNLDKYTLSVDKIGDLAEDELSGKVALISQQPYDFKSAFAAVKSEGYAGHCYVAAYTFGSLGEIIAGYSVREVRETNQILKDVERRRDSLGIKYPAAYIDSNERIRVVLIADNNDNNLERNLRDRGWRNWKDFYDVKFRSTIKGLIRE